MQVIDNDKLLDLTAEKMARLRNPDRLVSKEEAAEMFGYCPRYFAERIACKPDFPRQVMTGRWRYGDLVGHLDRISRAASQSRRRSRCSNA